MYPQKCVECRSRRPVRLVGHANHGQRRHQGGGLRCGEKCEPKRCTAAFPCVYPQRTQRALGNQNGPFCRDVRLQTRAMYGCLGEANMRQHCAEHMGRHGESSAPLGLNWWGETTTNAPIREGKIGTGAVAVCRVPHCITWECCGCAAKHTGQSPGPWHRCKAKLGPRLSPIWAPGRCGGRRQNRPSQAQIAHAMPTWHMGNAALRHGRN